MFPKFFISLLLTTSLLISFVDGIDDTCSADNNPFLSLDEKPLEVDCSQAAGTPEFKLCCEFCHLEGTLRNGTSPAECPPTCIYNDRFYNLLENCRRHRSTCCYQIWDSCPVGMGYDENSQNSGSFLACPPKTFNPPKSEERMRDGKYFVCQECSFRWCLGKKICDPITGEVDTIKCYLGFIIIAAVAFVAIACVTPVLIVWKYRKNLRKRERARVQNPTGSIPYATIPETTGLLNGISSTATSLTNQLSQGNDIVVPVAEVATEDLLGESAGDGTNIRHLHESGREPYEERYSPLDSDEAQRAAGVSKEDPVYQVNHGGRSPDQFNENIPERISP